MEAQRLIEVFNREVFGKPDTVITKPVEKPDAPAIPNKLQAFLEDKIGNQLTSNVDTKEDTQMENPKPTDKTVQNTVPIVTVADIEDISARADVTVKVFGVSKADALRAVTKLKKISPTNAGGKQHHDYYSAFTVIDKLIVEPCPSRRRAGLSDNTKEKSLWTTITSRTSRATPVISSGTRPLTLSKPRGKCTETYGSTRLIPASLSANSRATTSIRFAGTSGSSSASGAERRGRL